MNIKTFAVSTSLIVSSVFLPASVLAVAPISATPTTVITKDAAKMASPTAEGSVMEKKVEYALPYPGMLPDHPLYFLKNLRDQIFERLIADPVRKAEFYVLQADKRMNMALFLQAKGNESMTIDSLGKANTYMKMALATTLSLKEQGKEAPAYIVEKLTNALAKHQEVGEELVTKSPEGNREKFVNALSQIKDVRGQAAKLKE